MRKISRMIQKQLRRKTGRKAIKTKALLSRNRNQKLNQNLSLKVKVQLDTLKEIQRTLMI